MNKKIITIFAFISLSLLFTSVSYGQQSGSSASIDTRITRNLDIFNSLFKELNLFYVDSLDVDKTMETAINSMLDDIDPYTEYIPASSREDFMVISTGEYGGIGSYIYERNGNVYISEPYEGSPAAKVGLKPGDRIVMIDGVNVEGWGSDKVSERLKGQASTTLELLISRKYDGPDSLKTFNIVREKIKVDPVSYYGVTHGNIGYIALETFNEHSAANVKEALLKLKANPEVKNIVLDLRGNGGGLLESSIQIVGLFVPKGTQVLQTRGKTKQQERTYKTTEEPVDTQIPLAVLVDGGTASAAEITAGALQDLDRAVVIGTRSFGKGLVQATRQLPFDALLKVTVSKYYIPSGRLIQEIDYSNKDEDGTPKHTTDSTTQYQTAHGRVVTGGGGITPDIKIPTSQASRLAYNIVRDGWDFDYAVKYVSEHPTIPSPEEFVITDEIFNDFKSFIDPKRFEYDKVCETSFASLKKTAEAEGYLNDETREEFDRLEKLLKHDLYKDLDIHRDDIEKLLAKEIIKNYYYQRGQMIYGLRKDKATQSASDMFNKPGEYEKILNLPYKPAASSSSTQGKKKSSKR
ncbi:MAG: S41 family peptidase [Muribaculaceae bacterium]|nr:S41 family peptidase [Muribaculaceae bacterium]